MNAALLLVAILSAGQVDPPARPNPRLVRPTPAVQEETPAPLPFTLDDLAAGARNDAFVDEYLKEKPLSVFGQVRTIERFTNEDKIVEYRLLMVRLGHEDRAVDVEVACYFSDKVRKELAKLEPGLTRVTVQGTCKKASLTSVTKGHGFLLDLQDCKIVETPASFLAPPPRAPSGVVPNIVEPAALPPGLTPNPNVPLPPGIIPPGIVPPRGPALPPLPQQP